MLNLVPLPWRILALALLLCGGLGAGFVAGLRYEANSRDAQTLRSVTVAHARAEKETARREQVAQRYEDTRETVRTVYVAIEKEGERNVEKNADAYAACGLDADGLRIWNAANAGDAEALRGGAESAVPGTAASGIGALGRPVP